MKIKIIILALISFACNTSKRNDEIKKNENITNSIQPKMSDVLFKKKVTIILSETLEENSNNINIQDYEKFLIELANKRLSHSKYSEGKEIKIELLLGRKENIQKIIIK